MCAISTGMKEMDTFVGPSGVSSSTHTHGGIYLMACYMFTYVSKFESDEDVICVCVCVVERQREYTL